MEAKEERAVHSLNFLPAKYLTTIHPFLSFPFLLCLLLRLPFKYFFQAIAILKSQVPRDKYRTRLRDSRTLRDRRNSSIPRVRVPERTPEFHRMRLRNFPRTDSHVPRWLNVDLWRDGEGDFASEFQTVPERYSILSRVFPNSIFIN